jgi:hypothetical protein
MPGGMRLAQVMSTGVVTPKALLSYTSVVRSPGAIELSRFNPSWEQVQQARVPSRDARNAPLSAGEPGSRIGRAREV